MALFTAIKTSFSNSITPFTGGHGSGGTSKRMKKETPKCPYQLRNDSSKTFRLPDGRELGYAEYGSPIGHPILYLHSLPGSRIEAARHDDLGRELGARIIAIDRPGIGWSSPHPNRSLIDFPKDLERLAQHLNLQNFSVLGISGGGPYALACAAVLPTAKLKSVSIVCGLGPPDIGMNGANWIHWLAFTWGYRYIPSWLGKLWWKGQPVGRLDLTDEERLELSMRRISSLQKGAHDRENHVIVNNLHVLQIFLQAGREAFAQGYDGVWEDGRLMCNDFGFKIEDINSSLPVQLWYGSQDTFVPLNHGVQIARRLGERAQLRVKNEGHSGIAIIWNREILEALLASVRTSR